MRTDKETGKTYYNNNIPVDRINCFTLPNGKKLRIFPENGTTDCWYNDRFIGDRYAVFRYNDYGHFWQQCSKWYIYYGNAVNAMLAYNPYKT